jgi:polyhydroxyalkanoate synthase
MKKTEGKGDALEVELKQTPELIEGGEDVGFMDPEGIAEVLGKVMNKVDNVAKEGYALSAELLKILKGDSEIAPDPKDWRFADSTWKENPVYHRWAQAYLAWSQSMNRLVEKAELDWRNNERAQFAMNVITSAVAPTNQIFGNPAAMKRAIDTGGMSLLAGMKNMVNDMRHNGGMPSQVDRTPFKKGENTAATPGAVVFRNEMCELIQYTPQTPKVYTKPVVMLPPQINRYYFIDLAPGKSKIDHVVKQGITWFTISWKNPTKEQGDRKSVV